MYKDNKKDISKGEEINYAMISLLSHKTNIGIIGAGEAGFIKARHFLKEGFKVYMIANHKPKDRKILEFINSNKNLIFNIQNYNKDFILNKHIIIICVNDYNVRQKIIKDCEKLSKIYINSSDYKEGMAIVSAQKTYDNIILGVNTKGANPKGALFILNKLQDNISKYDSYIKYTSEIRKILKKHQNIKSEALKFIFHEDFYFFFKKEKADLILKLFYDNIRSQI